MTRIRFGDLRSPQRIFNSVSVDQWFEYLKSGGAGGVSSGILAFFKQSTFPRICIISFEYLLTSTPLFLRWIGQNTLLQHPSLNRRAAFFSPFRF